MKNIFNPRHLLHIHFTSTCLPGSTTYITPWLPSSSCLGLYASLNYISNPLHLFPSERKYPLISMSGLHSHINVTNTRPYLYLDKLYIWVHVEELAPIHALYWRRNLRYEIINYHKKRALTVQGNNYDDIQSKLRQYKNPLFKEVPTLITNSCTCQVNFEYEPSPKDSQKYFAFRSENVHRITESIAQVLIYNSYETGSVYINSKQEINLFKGINAICFCFFQYRFQKLKEYFGDNNRYNIELTGGPLYRLVKVHTKNKYKAYFILYRKYHTCIDYTSQGDIPTLLELSKSALITGNISYTCLLYTSPSPRD